MFTGVITVVPSSSCMLSRNTDVLLQNLRPPLKLIQHVYRAAMSMNCKCLSGDGLDWRQWNATQ